MARRGANACNYDEVLITDCVGEQRSFSRLSFNNLPRRDVGYLFPEDELEDARHAGHAAIATPVKFRFFPGTQ
jgi:hypothetical protein